MISKAQMWNAVINNDASFDGVFYYAVQTTNIFCKPSCRSKQPLQSHVQFFHTKEDALQAGFRPCKRCRPDLVSYLPQQELLHTIKTLAEKHFTDFGSMKQIILDQGISYAHCSKLWKETYGNSISQYINQLRCQKAMQLLRESEDSIMQIAMQCGFSSLSTFYSKFKQHSSVSPTQYRMNMVQLHDS